MDSQDDQLHTPILESMQCSSSTGNTFESSSELEKVLSDLQLPWLRRLLKATWIELKLLFRLAAPAILVYLINNAMSLSTRVFAGHLGNLELAAATLGKSSIQLAYGLMVTHSSSANSPYLTESHSLAGP